jgi:salicylate hydroxylase
VIIGDAAHPMLPCKPCPPDMDSHVLTPDLKVQGQAGAQAIEDGAALGIVFSKFTATDYESISERLVQFENIRRNRASVMQLLSNAGQDEAAKVRESVLPYMPDGNVPSEFTRPAMIIAIADSHAATPAGYAEHNFKYDVFAACEAEMSNVNGKL